MASLRNQTNQDWEAICVDDGSTDGTLDVLLQEARQDNRINVWTQANAGPSRARNNGVAQAKGEWIAFLDADDVWYNDKLATVNDDISGSPYTAAHYGRVAFFDPQKNQTTTYSTVTDGATALDQLLGENPVCTLSNLCVRRDVFLNLRGFRANMRYSEDLEFLIRLITAGHTLIGTTSLLVRYRASIDGLSANLMQMHAGWRQAILSAGAGLTPPQRARAEAIHLRYLARRALRLNIPAKTAQKLAFNGMKRAPLAFLGGRHRGPLTFVSCLIAPLIPRALRRRFFA